MVYIKWLRSGECEVWWVLSRSERQGFTNLSERETGLKERHRESLLSVGITVSLLNCLPPPSQRSAWAIYDACLTCVSCNDEVKCVCMHIHPLCECLIPEQSCFACCGLGISAWTNTLKKPLDSVCKAFLFLPLPTLQSKALCTGSE